MQLFFKVIPTGLGLSAARAISIERFLKDNEATVIFFTENHRVPDKKNQTTDKDYGSYSRHVAKAGYPGMKEHCTPRYLKMQNETWLYHLLKDGKK